MRVLAFNLLVASVVAALALDRCASALPDAAPPAAVSAPKAEPIAPAPALTPAGAVSIVRSPDGHFRADGSVNGTAARFLVDTGASTVAFGRAEARRMGVFVSDADFTATGLTAAGPVKAAPVTLRRMSVGAISATDVPATVVDVPTLTPLLGQSFLGQLSQLSIRGERMELR